MTVALCGRRANALYETLTLMAPGKGHLRLQGDITDPVVRRGLRDYLWKHWRGLDVLVNNAGALAVGPLAHTTDAELERVLATNVIAPAALSREMLPLLRRAMSSRIVNVGSMFGDIAYPLFATYSASKFALRGLSIAMRRELKPYGVGVTYAAPRATRTESHAAFDRLVAPMQMRVDDPANVAAQIWRAVGHELDTSTPEARSGCSCSSRSFCRGSSTGRSRRRWRTRASATISTNAMGPRRRRRVIARLSSRRKGPPDPRESQSQGQSRSEFPAGVGGRSKRSTDEKGDET